jgi:sugar (pentulose or hexulose) kinase
MHILALDVGTSSVKAAVLDQESGEPVAPPARAAYPLEHPTHEAAELTPEKLWSAIDAAAREAVAAAAGKPVEGVGLGAMTPALVLLDASDKPLSPIWTHLDRRGRPQAHRTQDEVGGEFLRTVGTRPLPGGTSAVCFARQLADDPGLRDRVKHYLHAGGWIGFRLTGERAFDPANASFTGLFGTLTDRRWSPRWCEFFGVDPAWLPPVRDGADTLGGLRPEVASAWGLKPGIPVKVGTADTSMAILAAGLGPRDLLHSVGTTQVLAVLVEHPKPDPRRLTRLLGVGDEYVYVSHNPVGGVALDWMHALCFHDQPAGEYFGKTVPAAAGRETPVRLDPWFLGGDRLEIDPKFTSFTHLNVSTTRDDLLAAVLHAMRDGHRAALEALDRTPADVARVFLTGGAADTVRHILPEYDAAEIRPLDNGSLRGIARLFDRG